MSASCRTVTVIRSSNRRISPSWSNGCLPNREIAAAFAATLGDLEILLRNAMHDQLTAWSTAQHAEPRWYLYPARLLTNDAHADIIQSRRRATRNARPPLP